MAGEEEDGPTTEGQTPVEVEGAPEEADLDEGEDRSPDDTDDTGARAEPGG